ncbi:hypothetical protein E2562_017470 [Oryza meyeriana var. granulata]|uniref:NAC domain-containing protein n=1 Tax=Oryza meyeriana var. granulata TaxID=110450 RepID=A0A6G1DYV6_9ORYZ|nr:hypothetical protein E2562_017470 [Oryza meyeriana var. granulata]
MAICDAADYCATQPTRKEPIIEVKEQVGMEAVDPPDAGDSDSEAAGGLWKHSRTGSGKSVTDLGVVVPWSETYYYFYRHDEGGRLSTFGEGWGLSEYEITEPGTYRRADEGEDDEYWVLCHVRKTAGKKLKRRRQPRTATELKSFLFLTSASGRVVREPLAKTSQLG